MTSEDDELVNIVYMYLRQIENYYIAKRPVSCQLKFNVPVC